MKTNWERAGLHQSHCPRYFIAAAPRCECRESDEGDIHLIESFDPDDHSPDSQCWCIPDIKQIYEEDDITIWAHRSAS